MDKATKRSVALGFRVHTGWAAAVAVRGAPPRVEVLRRVRMELLDPAGDVPRFIYHEAKERNALEAARLVQRAEEEVRATARRAVVELTEQLRSSGTEPVVSAVPGGTTKVPADLTAILRSHALIHAAEGALFRQALIAACEACGLRVIPIREREVWIQAADRFGLDSDALRKQIAALGKALGPPWSEDQKLATAAALAAWARQDD